MQKTQQAPIHVQGLLKDKKIRDIAAGIYTGWTYEGFSLALDGDGVVYSWGYNGHGELGVMNTLDSNVPIPVVLPPGVNAISAGGNACYGVHVRFPTVRGISQLNSCRSGG